MEHSNISKPRFVGSTRFFMGLLLFFGYCFNYMQKIDMSIAIVCMINHTALESLSSSPINYLNLNNATYFSNTTYSEKCSSSNTNTKLSYNGPFVWTKSTQGLILSAYFYGYILTQLLGGWLSFRFGGKKMLGLSMGIGSTITLIIPFSARLSHIALIICLFFNGIAHGAFWPSVSSFWAFWAPSSERSRLIGIASSGAKFGNIFALSLGGILCVYGFDGGWASIFYIFGLMGICWSLLFFILASDSPSDNKFISTFEKNFIIEETKKSIKLREISQKQVPWVKILTSKACISIFIGHFAHNWGNYLFLTQIPSFLKDVLKFDMKSNGFISSIPYIASWIATASSSIISDHMTRSKKISRTSTRRIFSFISLFLPSIALIFLSFINCSYVYIGVVLLTIGVSLDSIMNGAGYLININEIAGPYSGVLFGISNTIATIPGILSPYVASIITKNHSQSEWQIVFVICSVIYCIGGIFNILLLDANIQPWAKIDEAQTIKSETQDSA